MRRAHVLALLCLVPQLAPALAPAGMDGEARAWREFAVLDAGDAPVWEGWRNVRQTLLPGGADPGPWPDQSLREAAPAERFQTGSMAGAVPARRVVDGRLQSFDPVFDAAHLNETRLNRTAYDYIRAQDVYSVDDQLLRLRLDQAPDFLVGAVLVKAQWRPLAADEAVRYHTLWLVAPDGSRRLYGLAALNLSLKQHAGPDGWLFAAFEHLDHCTGPAPQCGGAPAGAGLEGTVWENYRLRGTMERAVDARGRPRLLASSQLEAGVQRSSSCITCHARASIGLADGRPARL